MKSILLTDPPSHPIEEETLQDGDDRRASIPDRRSNRRVKKRGHSAPIELNSSPLYNRSCPRRGENSQGINSFPKRE
uniref:Uncharacterized protein n=1 Tax=Salix viminalis TaxID=40686 RepID=A0A6N2N4Z4_SALVM